MRPPKLETFKPEDVKEVGDAIKLLIGARNESFELERELRLFQFKTWLLEIRPSRSSFRQSALLFATLLVSARQRQRKFSLLAPSEAIALTIMSHELRPLIDYAFKNQSLYQLTMIRVHAYNESLRKGPLGEIGVLNALTQFRLRLPLTKGMTPSINNGIALLSNSNEGTRLGKTNAKALRRRRRARKAFLYAAQHCPEMTSLPPQPAEIVRALKSELRETARINEYFALAKSFMKVLDEEVTLGFDEYWNGLAPVDIPPLQPVSQEEMDEAGIGPRFRRSARETKLAKREAPTGSR